MEVLLVRLFVAVSVPSDISGRLSAMAGGLPGARWTRDKNFHLTLRFIGYIDEGVADDVDGALLEIDAPPFDVSIAGIGYFGKAKTARALWAGVDTSEPLIRLQQKIESAMQRIGLAAEERKYAPHITLARLKGTPQGRLENFVTDHCDFRARPVHVETFTLYSSFLSSSGAIYTPEVTYPLNTA